MMQVASSNGTVAQDIHLQPYGGNVGIRTTNPTANLTIRTGLSGGTNDVANQPAGSINFGNLSSSAAVPTISGKSTTSTGLFITSLTSDGNTLPDMQFTVREDDNTDFSTLSGKIAFRWNRFTTRLGQVSREGAWTIGPSGGEVPHKLNGRLQLQKDTQTISSGLIAATNSYTIVDTQGSASTDNLAGITGGTDGDVVIIMSVTASRNIVIKHEDSEASANDRIQTPNGADITIDTTAQSVTLIYRDVRWHVISDATS
jgi:hypothetical protein